MSSVPHDRFTPHGYLDNPFHSRNLNPSGVIRSSEGIGVAWHYPALARGYGFREIYRCAFEIAVVDETAGGAGRRAVEDLHADVHTCNRLRYRFRTLGLEVSAMFHRVEEHGLACRIEISNPADEERSLRFAGLARYARHLGAAGVWGESGLVCRAEGDALVVQGFEDGEAFALLGSRPADALGAWAPFPTGRPTGKVEAGRAEAAVPPSTSLRDPSLSNGDHAVVTGHRDETVVLSAILAHDLHVPPGATVRHDLVLARGLRRDLAAAQAHRAWTLRDEALAEAVSSDERFWRNAPRLEGDWPDAWRRGFATDLETLRMMVRAPAGIYTHSWDAMQVQAPRVVLAEASIDALLLGYADPELGQHLLLGTFLDAPAANVPCSREDGSYNMVGANGSACGTAPEWGYPVEVARHLYRLRDDRAWLAALYPALARFLRWWIEERSDSEGYMVYDNSWESGQDLSARFGPQKEGGGSTIRMVRPVDLQAAMASACATMAVFAQELDLRDEAADWSGHERAFRDRTESLWHAGSYRDFDARVGFSDEWDVMQLAPVALGLVRPDRVDALAPSIDRLSADDYLWPMFVWTAVDAALAAERPDVAATIIHRTVDRAWRTWDRSEAEPGAPLPGVTCEYWGVDGHCGAEGYGWGAFGVHLLIHGLVGFRPHDGALELKPALPNELRVPGRCYRVRNLPWKGTRIDVELRVPDQGDELQIALIDRGLRHWVGADRDLDPGHRGDTHEQHHHGVDAPSQVAREGYVHRLTPGHGLLLRCDDERERAPHDPVAGAAITEERD